MTLPRGGAKYTVGLVHAVVFVLAYMVLKQLVRVEGFRGGNSYGPSDMFGRGRCWNPYNCKRGTGWTGSMSGCECQVYDANKDLKAAWFYNTNIDTRKLRYA